MLLVGAWTAFASAASIPDDVAPWVQAQLALGRVSAVVVGVREGGASTYAAFGWRDAARTDPVAPTDVFEIGSITKTFTAALFADAIQRGELTPDVRLSEVLGADATLRVDPTLAALATHHSRMQRMPCHVPSSPPGEHAFAAWDEADLRRDLASCPVNEGTGYAYSNFGFATLGLALATRAGAPWRELLDARLLGPMGLAGRIAMDGFDAERVVAGWNGHATAAPWAFDAMAPAGGLRADASALLDWGSLHRPGAEGPWAATATLATAERADLAPPNVSTGYAWFRYAEPARSGFEAGPGVVGHGGSTGYFQAQLLFDTQRVVVVLVAGTDADDLAFHVMRPERAPLPPLPRQVRMPDEDLAAFAGLWRVGDGGGMRVWVQDGHLMARVRGQREEALWPIAPDVFGWAVVDARVAFRRDAEGRVESGTLVQGAPVAMTRATGRGGIVEARRER